jgi:hypothetical protein
VTVASRVQRECPCISRKEQAGGLGLERGGGREEEGATRCRNLLIYWGWPVRMRAVLRPRYATPPVARFHNVALGYRAALQSRATGGCCRAAGPSRVGGIEAVRWHMAGGDNDMALVLWRTKGQGMRRVSREACLLLTICLDVPEATKRFLNKYSLAGSISVLRGRQAKEPWGLRTLVHLSSQSPRVCYSSVNTRECVIIGTCYCGDTGSLSAGIKLEPRKSRALCIYTCQRSNIIVSHGCLG